MRSIDCCVCLEDNVEHYTHEFIITKCNHPICKNCYLQLIISECPLCRIRIYSLLADIEKAIYNVLFVRYEKFLNDIEYYDLIFLYGNWGVLIITKTKEYVFLYRSKMIYMMTYYYLHCKPIKSNIIVNQKVCSSICV
jgi:hypothetical protein